jgi:hypothetical protein
MKENIADPAQCAELIARLERLTPETPRRWGKMTAHQVVCHLSDSFRAVMGTGLSSVATPWSRTVIKWMALNAPLKWPHGVPTRPEVDQFIGGTRPVEFARDRQELTSLMADFAARTGGNLHPHPMFGAMTTREWHRWGWRHMDHHLRQFGA